MFTMIATLLLSVIAAALSAATACTAATTTTEESYAFPLPIHNGSASPDTRQVGTRPLDTTYITRPNSSTYEWWYFDAVAHDLSASIVLQPVVEGGAFVLVLDLQYANASNGKQLIPQFMLPYDKGHFSAKGHGSNIAAANGEWNYTSAPDLSLVTYHLDIPKAGVSGTVQFQPVGPRTVCHGVRTLMA
jgi:hypothetical protein